MYKFKLLNTEDLVDEKNNYIKHYFCMAISQSESWRPQFCMGSKALLVSIPS